MSKVIKRLFTGLLLLVSAGLFAQNNNPQGGDWMARMRSEKIAFLTSEIGLTPEEAQAFWPIYNKAEAEQSSAFEATMKAFRALEEAVRQKKSESEISRLLDEYTSAVSKSETVSVKYVAQYKKVLSAEKVAKLFLAEERFRNNQIHRLQGGGFNQQNRNNGAGGSTPGFGFPWRNNTQPGTQRQQGTQRQSSGTQKQDKS